MFLTGNANYFEFKLTFLFLMNKCLTGNGHDFRFDLNLGGISVVAGTFHH